jgi:hypothetical protein
MSFSWATYLADGLAPDPWMRGEWGHRFWAAIGEELDAAEATLVAGIRARFPSCCPDDGLWRIGEERGGIDRAPGESQDAYVARLLDAPITWKWSGTTTGILRAFEALGWTATSPAVIGTGMPTVWPTAGHVWCTYPYDWAYHCPDGDNDLTHYARFWVLVDYYAERGAATAKVRGAAVTRGVYLRGPYYTISLAEHAAMLKSIRKWKDSRSTCREVIFILSDGGFEDVRGAFNTRSSSRTRGGTTFPVQVGEKA